MSNQKHNEEEISLGATGATPQPTGEQPAQDDNMLSHRHGSLEDLLSPGMSEQDIVQAIVDAPQERLIPWERCKLPSLGIYYGWDNPFCEIRGMGQDTEKILADQRLAQSGQSIDHVFQKCCRFPNDMDPLDLLAGDRVFLLYYLRGITHGNIYEFAITCQRPDCKQVSTHSYDLNNLAGTIKWANPSSGEEPFKVVLPYLSESTRREFWVGVRFLRGRDTNNMITIRRTRNKLMAKPAVRAGRGRPQQRNSEPSIDETLTENLQMVIASVMGVTDRMTINRFVPRMHATDTAAIREWLRDNSPGIETTVTIGCPECGQEFIAELPITESFFRPTQKRGI